jgi:Cys-rich repeat protein
MKNTSAFILFSVLLLGCFEPKNSIDECQVSSIDCCVADWECEEFYENTGTDDEGRPINYPFCTTPGETTGICSECLSDSDCDDGEYCDKEEGLPNYCLSDDLAD